LQFHEAASASNARTFQQARIIVVRDAAKETGSQLNSQAVDRGDWAS
jgi:hypothetical protein